MRKGRAKGKGGQRTRSRGLLAGRLAVKIEICTDSSMRAAAAAAAAASEEAEEGECECVTKARRLENQICHASCSTSARSSSRLSSASSLSSKHFSRIQPFRCVSHSRFTLPSLFFSVSADRAVKRVI